MSPMPSVDYTNVKQASGWFGTTSSSTPLTFPLVPPGDFSAHSAHKLEDLMTPLEASFPEVLANVNTPFLAKPPFVKVSSPGGKSVHISQDCQYHAMYALMLGKAGTPTIQFRASESESHCDWNLFEMSLDSGSLRIKLKEQSSNFKKAGLQDYTIEWASEETKQAWLNLRSMYLKICSEICTGTPHMADRLQFLLLQMLFDNSQPLVRARIQQYCYSKGAWSKEEFFEEQGALDPAFRGRWAADLESEEALAPAQLASAVVPLNHKCLQCSVPASDAPKTMDAVILPKHDSVEASPALASAPKVSAAPTHAAMRTGQGPKDAILQNLVEPSLSKPASVSKASGALVDAAAACVQDSHELSPVLPVPEIDGMKTPVQPTLASEPSAVATDAAMHTLRDSKKEPAALLVLEPEDPKTTCAGQDSVEPKSPTITAADAGQVAAASVDNRPAGHNLVQSFAGTSPSKSTSMSVVAARSNAKEKTPDDWEKIDLDALELEASPSGNFTQADSEPLATEETEAVTAEAVEEPTYTGKVKAQKRGYLGKPINGAWGFIECKDVIVDGKPKDVFFKTAELGFKAKTGDVVSFNMYRAETGLQATNVKDLTAPTPVSMKLEARPLMGPAWADQLDDDDDFAGNAWADQLDDDDFCMG